MSCTVSLQISTDFLRKPNVNRQFPPAFLFFLFFCKLHPNQVLRDACQSIPINSWVLYLILVIVAPGGHFWMIPAAPLCLDLVTVASDQWFNPRYVAEARHSMKLIDMKALD